MTNGTPPAAAQDVLRKSVTKDDYLTSPQSGVIHWIIPNLSSGGPDLPNFWSPSRDYTLKSTLYRESMWADAISIAIGKIAARGFDVDSDIPLRAKRAQDLFLNFDSGKGYVSGLQKHLQDFLLTGNGGHVEIVRASRALGSRIIGLVPLDTMRCRRTGDPDYPIIYRDRLGAEHIMREWDVFSLTDMPDPADTWYGVGHCLDRESYIRMADGSNKKIAQLVKERSTELVATIDESGALTARPIIGWHENPIAGRKWVNVRGEASSRATGKVSRNLWATEDHPILTPTKWVKAGDLNNGDEIVTEFPTPNRKQMELIVGSVLGDMSILRSKNGNARLSEGHHVHQAEWLSLKALALADFGLKERTYKNNINVSGRVTPGLNDLRGRCYPNGGKKAVPPELVEEYLSPMLLAAWYLDDGWISNRNDNDRNRKPTACIGNSGAEFGHTQTIVDMLNRHGYKCTALSSRGKDNPRKDIHFTVEGSAKLFETIAPYVPESMRYKLPCGAQSFNITLWNLGKANRFIDKAIVETKNSRSDAVVFCLDVEETHNFITSGLVVHNCAAERAYKAIIKLEAIERYITEKVSGQRVLAFHIVGGVTNQNIQDAKLTAMGEAQAKGVTTYMGAAIIAMMGDTPASVVTIPLAELPDGFARKEEWDIAITTYARALGIAVQDLQPLSGQGLGTGTQSVVLDEAAKGQGLAVWSQQWEHAVNEYALDDRTTYAIKTHDIRDRERESKVRIDEAAALEAWTRMGLSAPQAINLGVDRDQLPEEYRPEDLTPGQQLSDDEKPEQEQAEQDAAPQDVNAENPTLKPQQSAGGKPPVNGKAPTPAAVKELAHAIEQASHIVHDYGEQQAEAEKARRDGDDASMLGTLKELIELAKQPEPPAEPPQIVVNVPETVVNIPAPVVNVSPTPVNVAAPIVQAPPATVIRDDAATVKAITDLGKRVDSLASEQRRPRKLKVTKRDIQGRVEDWEER